MGGRNPAIDPEQGSPVKQCPLCTNGGQRPVLRTDDGYHVVRCVGCGFVYLTPRPPEHPDLSASVDPVWLAEEAFRRLDDRLRLDEIGRVRPNGRLLDVGCNCGFFLDEAKKRGYETRGVEIAAVPAEYGRANLGLDITTSEFEVADFNGDVFDIVTMWHVLEHMPEPTVTLRKVRRTLVDGGLLAIEVPRFDSWMVRLLGRRHRHIGHGHAGYYTETVLCRLLEEHGYRVLTCRNVGRTLSLQWLAVRVSQSLGPFKSPIYSLVRKSFSRHFGGTYVNLGDIMRVYAVKEPLKNPGAS